jgi:hypothetical protein
MRSWACATNSFGSLRMRSLTRPCVDLQREGNGVVRHMSFATYWRSAQDHAKRGKIAKAFAFVRAKTRGGLAVGPIG